MPADALLPKVAVQSTQYAKMAIVEGGMLASIDALKAKGYLIAASHDHARELRECATTAVQNGAKAYLDAVLALPEAADRPAAAAKLASCHTFHSMPLPRASLFLAGLDAETADAAPLAKVYSAEQEAKLKRLLELHANGLSLKAARGDHEAKSEARKVNYALSIVASSNCPPSQAVEHAGVNVKLIKSR